MLSQKGRYALKALTHIAQQTDAKPSHVKAIAEAQNIPYKFLEAIMSELRRAHLVVSIRGQGGGYRLARASDEIMFSDVIRAIDGPLALVPCASVNFYQRCEDCTDEATCVIRRVMIGVRDEVNEVLGKTSLADAVNMTP